GTGTVLMSKIREEYPDRMVCTYTPSPQPHNAIVLDHQLVKKSSETSGIDSAAPRATCFRSLGACHPNV
ncbi:hypothetical protein EDC04DRAFT_2562432, partial [Pisolithus marmoratus]